MTLEDLKRALRELSEDQVREAIVDWAVEVELVEELLEDLEEKA